MTPEEVRQSVVAWFADVRSAGLKLPSGWFGRPYDSLHQLTGAYVHAGRLVLVLDDQLLLILAHVSAAVVSGPVLRLAGFAHAVWDRDEYGSGRPHVETFDSGQVEFIASSAARLDE